MSHLFHSIAILVIHDVRVLAIVNNRDAIILLSRFIPTITLANQTHRNIAGILKRVHHHFLTKNKQAEQLNFLQDFDFCRNDRRTHVFQKFLLVVFFVVKSALVTLSNPMLPTEILSTAASKGNKS